MFQMRPMLVVTGTIKAEGGEKNEMKHVPSSQTSSRERVTIVQEREITRDRRRANVVATNFMRRLRKLRILKTPYGTIVDPKDMNEVKAIMADATKQCADFNLTSKTCKLANCLLWEHLRGNRLASVQGWIARRIEDGDPEVRAVQDALAADAAAA